MNQTTDQNKKYHTFKIPYDEKYCPARVAVTLHLEASLYEAIESFKSYLEAVGYVLPENTTIGLLERDI